MLPTEPQVDPRVRRTRQLLVDALDGLMRERDYEAITVQDIAARATVNRATFYAHFEGKPELLDYTIRERFNDALRARLAADAHLCDADLELVISTLCDFLGVLGDHCVPARHRFFDVLQTPITAQVRQLLLAWLMEARPAAGHAANELAAVAASWALFGAVYDWTQRERRSTPAEFASRLRPLLREMLDAAAEPTTPGTMAEDNAKARTPGAGLRVTRR